MPAAALTLMLSTRGALLDKPDQVSVADRLGGLVTLALSDCRLIRLDGSFLDEVERVSTLIPKDPAFQVRIQASFDKQGLMSTLGASILHVGPGAVDIALVPSPSVSQQHGFVHAGAVAAIADTAAGYAALSLMPPGAGVLTTEFKINLLTPAIGDRIVARGRVVKAGRTLTLAQTEVFADHRGQTKLTALLTATLMTIQDRDGVTD
ncbi:MAG TPA: PaaI family thioesterase [Microvirga sp.]|nr:PaaI family thioesterase [Microvirga sp.]